MEIQEIYNQFRDYYGELEVEYAHCSKGQHRVGKPASALSDLLFDALWYWGDEVFLMPIIIGRLIAGIYCP